MGKSSRPPANLQQPLAFGAPRFGDNAFIDSHASARARQALARWQTWPGGALCLLGEAGSGKSHLAAIWALKSGAASVKGADLTLRLVEDIKASAPMIMALDDADASDETALFALLTRLEREGGAVLMVAQSPPANWPVALPDLRSRLASVAVETLLPPEPDLLAKLIRRYGAARGFRLDVASADFLAARIPRTFAAVEAIVSCLDRVASPSLKTPMSLAQRALRAFYPENGDHEAAASGDLFEA